MGMEVIVGSGDLFPFCFVHIRNRRGRPVVREYTVQIESALEASVRRYCDQTPAGARSRIRDPRFLLAEWERALSISCSIPYIANAFRLGPIVLWGVGAKGGPELFSYSKLDHEWKVSRSRRPGWCYLNAGISTIHSFRWGWVWGDHHGE